MFFKIDNKWKYYREVKQDLERFSIILSTKMSAKSKKKFENYSYLERRAEPLGYHVPFVLRQKRKKTKVSEAAIGGVL